MTGTSADAVDAALVDFSATPPQLIGSHCLALPSDLRQAILALVSSGPDELHRTARLEIQLVQYFAAAVHDLLQQVQLSPAAVRAIGSHGQTLRHRPDDDLAYTLQIGDPSRLAELTAIQVVADFRRRDVAAGGQGAPLAPAFHQAFFHSTEESRLVINIGGIANLTWLAAADEPLLGYDTGPGNGLLDAWSDYCRGEAMDKGGAWAASGEVNKPLLEQLSQDAFFARSGPKSTGRDHFDLAWLQQHLQRCNRPPAMADVQATLLQLTVTSIAAEVAHFPAKRVLICGGGVHNNVLMAALQRACQAVTVTSVADLGVDPDYLEAMGFAWLARQTLLGLPGNEPAVTGALGTRILGGIYPA